VLGRGELQLSILIEMMRREGYELMVGKPEIVTKRIDGKLMEPVEHLTVDVPEDFTRIVVANAESRVSGLRRPAERFHAFFVCSGLFLVIIFALGSSGSRTALDALFVVFDKVAAVGCCASHLAYDIAIGAVIIIRSLVSRLVLESSFSLLFPGIAAVYLFVVSRLMSLINRG